MYDNSRGTARAIWEKIDKRVIDNVHEDVWFYAAAKSKGETRLQWHEIMDRVDDAIWRTISPEVSGNRL